MAEPARLDGAARLAAWREQGAGAADPVRFCFIEALARRMAKQGGAGRELLERRLNQLIADYERRLQHGSDPKEAPDHPAEQGGMLAELLDRLGQHSAAVSGAASPKLPGGGEQAAPAPGELKAMRYFRSTWAKLSMDRQLALAIERAPENAGPLNSQHLVLQALRQMRDISPGYLQSFMSYVDALFWLELADGGRSPGPRNASGGEAEKPRKAARRKAG